MLYSFRFLVIFAIIMGSCLYAVTSNCTINTLHGLYCTNIGTINTQPININFKIEKDVSITSIFLINTTGIITNNTFASFPNLEHLEIHLSKIQNFTTILSSLDALYLINNRAFPNLTSDFFEKCPKLSNLIVAMNSGFNLFQGAFKHAKNLNHLTINDQNITHLKRGHLEGLIELRFLDLKHNHIQKIDEDAFEDLEHLNYLILSDNNLISFEENTFQNVPNLQSLGLLKLNITSINKSTFKYQKQLRYLEVPTNLVKEKLTLKNLTLIFSNLETIGLQVEDENDTDVNNFIKNCKYSGFDVKLVN